MTECRKVEEEGCKALTVSFPDKHYVEASIYIMPIARDLRPYSRVTYSFVLSAYRQRPPS